MKKIYNYFCKAEVGFCGVGFIFLVVLIFGSAILRFFRVSMAWNIDLAMLFLAWVSFLGADVAWRSGQLIGIDLVTRYFPKKVQKAIMIAVYLIILAVCVISCLYGMRLVWTERVRTFQSLPIPYALVHLSFVLATFSMSISTIAKIKLVIQHFNKSEDEVKNEVKEAQV